MRARMHAFECHTWWVQPSQRRWSLVRPSPDGQVTMAALSPHVGRSGLALFPRARASPGWPRRRREQCSADFVGRGAGRAPVPHGAVRSLCAVRSLRACRAGFLSYRSLRVRRVYRVLCTVSVPSEMKSICVCCPPLQRWLDAGRREFSPLKLLICCYYMAIVTKL